MKTISKAQLTSMRKEGKLKPTQDTAKAIQNKQVNKGIGDAVTAFNRTALAINGASSKISESVLKLADSQPRKKKFSFRIERDHNGLISSITATEE